MESRYGAVVLSKGGIWKPEPHDHPYLMPSNNGLVTWPERATAKCIFTDTKGRTLLTLDGLVKPTRIDFSGSAAQMDKVPAGAGFTIILDTRDGPQPIRHGRVIRREVEITTPMAQQDIPPLTINDNLQRTALGRKYKTLFGDVQMVDNSSAGLPFGIMAKSTKGAFRYIQEFTTSGIEIGVTLLNRQPDSAAWTSLNFCTDINAEMGYAVKFETGSGSAKRLHIGTLTAPMTIIDRAPVVANTVENNEYYRIRFIPELRTVSVYKGTSLEPLLEWADEGKIVPVGMGYRHLGASLYRATAGGNRGLQITSITARDAA